MSRDSQIFDSITVEVAHGDPRHSRSHIDIEGKLKSTVTEAKHYGDSSRRNAGTDKTGNRMSQYHVETAVVVEIGSDDCGRIFLRAGVWKVYRRIEGSIAVACEQRETGYDVA